MNYGVWAENIIPFSIHKTMVEVSGRKCIVEPGFWDTHYSKTWKNKMGNIFNSIISSNKNIGFLLAPFIYIIALPKTDK